MVTPSIRLITTLENATNPITYTVFLLCDNYPCDNDDIYSMLKLIGYEDEYTIKIDGYQGPRIITINTTTPELIPILILKFI
jgi:hypothetical protein